MTQKLFITALLGCSCLCAAAQTQPNDTTVNRTVIVEQEYNPTIRDAAKINVMPEAPALQANKKSARFALDAQPTTQFPAHAMPVFTGIVEREKGFPWKADLTHEWRKNFHRSHATAGWQHAFRQVHLNVGADFDHSHFSNHVISDAGGPDSEPSYEKYKHKLTSGALHVGVQSNDENRPVWFKAETNVQLFQWEITPHLEKAKESLIRTRGEVSAAINDAQRIALAIQMENVFYQQNEFKNYTALDLNPYFSWKTDDWSLHAGAHVNPSFGFGKKLRVAPDILAQYRCGETHILYAQATGGKILNDFRRLQEISPYSNPSQQLDATYEQVNAALGFKGSPLPGWWYHVYGGYQNLKDDLIAQASFSHENTSNVYAGAETRYNHKDFFHFYLQGTYRNWNADNEVALVFKPTLELQAKAGFRPLQPLQVSLGYHHLSRAKVNGQKLDDVCNLYAEAQYDVLRQIGIHVRLYNLLNQDYQEQWGWQASGLGFLGGVKFRF